MKKTKQVRIKGIETKHGYIFNITSAKAAVILTEAVSTNIPVLANKKGSALRLRDGVLTKDLADFLIESGIDISYLTGERRRGKAEINGVKVTVKPRVGLDYTAGAIIRATEETEDARVNHDKISAFLEKNGIILKKECWIFPLSAGYACMYKSPDYKEGTES